MHRVKTVRKLNARRIHWAQPGHAGLRDIPEPDELSQVSRREIIGWCTQTNERIGHAADSRLKMNLMPALAERDMENGFTAILRPDGGIIIPNRAYYPSLVAYIKVLTAKKMRR
jgi:hypothetical protein